MGHEYSGEGAINNIKIAGLAQRRIFITLADGICTFSSHSSYRPAKTKLYKLADKICKKIRKMKNTQKMKKEENQEGQMTPKK